jgi:hypothetical protein
MKQFGILVSLLVVAWASSQAADTLFTTPVIVVTPTTIKFGAADPHRAMTNTFLVENAGSGKLVGKATVKTPFKIISGGSYTLKQNEAQVITIAYLPTSKHSSTNLVKFTGGGGAQAKVLGIPTRQFLQKANPSRP